MKSALYTGSLVHVRHEPRRHVFKYPVAYWLLDLDELPELERRLRLLTVNGRNAITLRDGDHFDVQELLLQGGKELAAVSNDDYIGLARGKVSRCERPHL